MRKTANTTIGSRIRESREIAGLTQVELAEKIGITWKHLSALERSINNPSIATICKISDALAVSCDFLLKGEECGTTPTTFERIKYLSPKYQKILNDQINLMFQAQKDKE